MTLAVQVYDRTGPVSTYQVDDVDFDGNTAEEFYQWLDESDLTDRKKFTLRCRVGFIVDVWHPTLFYKFIEV